MPWSPVRISLKKLSIPIHTIDEISTPKAGGTRLRIGSSNGSVGQKIALKGNSFLFVLGYLFILFTVRQSVHRKEHRYKCIIISYHEITVRLRNRRFITLINISMTGLAILATEGSTSEAATAREGRASKTKVETVIVKIDSNLMWLGIDSDKFSVSRLGLL